MGSFSRKLEAPKSTVDPSKWSTWNQHVFDAFKAKATSSGEGRQRKQKSVPCVVNFIFDMGYPAAGLNYWPTKVALPEEEETYSEAEIEYMRKYEGSDFVWKDEFDNGKQVTKRKQTSQGYPVQEYALCVDVPSILVDWAKWPYAEEDAKEDLRPLRISVNDVYQGKIQTRIKFEVRKGEMSENIMLRRITKAAGIDEQFINGYDIGDLAQSVCNFKVKLDLVEKDGVVKLYDSVSTPSPIEDFYDMDDNLVASVADIKNKALSSKYLPPFTGILLDMDMSELTDDVLCMVGTGDQNGFVAHASTSIKRHVVWDNGNKEADIGFDYEGCNFQKAYDAWKEKEEAGRRNLEEYNRGEKQSSGGGKTGVGGSYPSGKGVAKGNVESKPEKATEVPSEEEGEDPFDQDIPF